MTIAMYNDKLVKNQMDVGCLVFWLIIVIIAITLAAVNNYTTSKNKFIHVT